MITYKIQITETAQGVSFQFASSVGTGTPKEIAVAQHMRTALDDTAKGVIALNHPDQLKQLQPMLRSKVPSINDTWTFFADTIYTGAQAGKRIECKRAYMAGALDLFTMMQKISQQFSEAEAEARLEVIHQELTTFFGSITSQDNPNQN